MIGETVGSYKLVEKLGEGGMGVVYLAEHKYIARRAAIKFLLPELSGSPDVVRRFFSEARAASLIQHPGIVEVLDCEVHRDGRAFIVMELLEGDSLRGHLRRAGKLDDDIAGALAICRQMTEALAAAHDQGIVHRDLKPDNVFLHLPIGRDAHRPVVKLLDFGIAKLLGGAEGGTKTRTGQLLGTPLYMSPEQCRGSRQVDSRSDIYSLGCIMFEMFCGRPPFLAEGFGDLIIAHVSQPPPDPVEFAPSLSPALRALLLGCLDKLPETRPPSMQELSKRLTELGAADSVRLRTPIVPAVAAAQAIAPSFAPGRPVVGWVSTPARVATTPFPQSARVEGPTQRAEAGPASTPTPIALQLRGMTTPAVPGGTELKSMPASSTFTEGASEMLDRELPGRGRARAVKIVLPVILAAIVVVAFVGLRASPDQPEANAKPTTPGPVEGPEKLPRPPSPDLAPRPSRPAVSSIRLTGLPNDATIRVDGQPAVVPVVVARGAQIHRVTVEAEGYETWERPIDGAADQIIAVELRKKSPAAATPPKLKHKNEHRHDSSGFSGFNDL